MSRNAVTDWSPSPASNTDIAGIDIGENCPAGGINDALRTFMAQIATWVAGPAAFGGDVTALNVKATSPNAGYVQLAPGDPTHTGSTSFRYANGAECGYIGFTVNGGALTYGSSNGAGHVFAGGPTLFNAKIARDSLFFLDKNSNDDVLINLGSSDYLLFARSIKKLFFVVNGVNVMSIDANGNMVLKGTLTQNGNP